MPKTDWTIQDIWNEQLVGDQWPIKKRDYIRASEIGGSMLDRYYKMTGVPFSNEFDPRILRVFQAGHTFEWIAGMVLKKAGIFLSTQDEIKIKGEGQHLDVIGHLDFIAGGKPDWLKIQDEIKLWEDVPAHFKTVSEAIVKEFQKKFPDGMKKMVYEIKSINSMVFWKHQKGEEEWKGYPHHVLQCYTYMKGAGIDEGRILYISKDDLTLAEVSVTADDALESLWQEDVAKISKHFVTKTPPDKEFELEYLPEKKKYEANWRLGRSNYLTKITGMEKEDWEKQFKNLANRCNARIKKILDKFPEVENEQIERVLEPYIDAEIKGIYGDGVVIKKDVDYDSIK